MTTQTEGIKFNFTEPAQVTEVSWQSIFTPKQSQFERFIFVYRAITPSEVRLFFDPVSHFLWKELTVNGNVSWMVADVPCRPAKSQIPAIERAVQHLQDAEKILSTTDLNVWQAVFQDGNVQRKVKLALGLLLELGR
jgi:hypothetical protein